MMEDIICAAVPAAPRYAIDWTLIEQTVMRPFVSDLKRTAQEPDFHGEGDVWTHTKMVCEELTAQPEFRSLARRQQEVVFLAALLHDVAKPRCSVLEDGVWHAPKHAPAGAKLAREYLWKECGLSGTPEAQAFREAICLLIRYHTTPLHTLQYSDAEARLHKLASNGALTPFFSLRLLHLLSTADMCGRICYDKQEVLEKVALSAEMAKESGCFDAPYSFQSDHTAHAYLSGRRTVPDAELYDETWGEVILMAGLPGTGKDTYIGEQFPSLPVVSLDGIRREKGISPTGDQSKVVSAARECAKALLRERQPFVWNATSLTPQLRQKQIRLFEDYGARVRIVYLETPWEENKRRNRNREHSVPEAVLEQMLSDLIPPERFEAQNVDWICI